MEIIIIFIGLFLSYYFIKAYFAITNEEDKWRPHLSGYVDTYPIRLNPVAPVFALNIKETLITHFSVIKMQFRTRFGWRKQLKKSKKR